MEFVMNIFLIDTALKTPLFIMRHKSRCWAEQTPLDSLHKKQTFWASLSLYELQGICIIIETAVLLRKTTAPIVCGGA